MTGIGFLLTTAACAGTIAALGYLCGFCHGRFGWRARIVVTARVVGRPAAPLPPTRRLHIIDGGAA